VDTLVLVKLLLDPDRLAVVGALATRSRTSRDVEEVTGVEHRTVLETIGTLRAEGALTEAEGAYRLDPWFLVAAAAPLPQPAPVARRILAGMTEAEQDVLGRFFSGERLVELPTKRSMRRVVLERIALEFEPGRHYTEPEVNDVLAAFFDEHVVLRRALVDERFLDRDPHAGAYWRAGGRVDV
jgi:hypothetical protein